MSTTNFVAPDPDRVRAKIKGEKAIRFQRYAFLSHAGVMRKLTWTEPMAGLATDWAFGRLLSRQEYDLDQTTVPGQRDTSESHIKKIAEGIKRSDRPYMGTLTIALDPEYVEIKELEQISEHVSLVLVTVRVGAPNPWIEDGQHRILVLGRVWPEVKDATEGDDALVRDHIERSSVEMTMLLEGDPDILSTIFVKMASTKAISPSLIAVMDKESMQNRLGQYVIRRSRLLRGRVTYLSTTAHKARSADKADKFEAMYPAAAVRSASAAIAGVGVRDRSPDQRENILVKEIAQRAAKGKITGEQSLEMLGNEVVSLLDYAYEHVPGWKEVAAQKLSVAEFRRIYLHSSAAGLHVIANVIAAARAAGVSSHAAIDALAGIPWKREDLQPITGPNGEFAMGHTFFEGNLAKTVFDQRKDDWQASASGATRSGYEAAIARVLNHLAREDKALEALAEHATFVAIGLLSERRGPGRPRKVEAETSTSAQGSLV